MNRVAGRRDDGEDEKKGIREDRSTNLQPIRIEYRERLYINKIPR